MHKSAIKTVSLLIISSLLLVLLAGCKTEGDIANNSADNLAYFSSDSKYSVKEIDDYVYLSQKLHITDVQDEIQRYAVGNGEIYFIATRYEQNADTGLYTTPIIRMYSYNIDKKESSVLENYSFPANVPVDFGGAFYINDMNIDINGNIWISEEWQLYEFNLPDNFNNETDDEWNYAELSGTNLVIRKLAADGSELESVEVGKSISQDNNASVQAFATDSLDNIYIYAAEMKNSAAVHSIYALDKLGGLKATYEIEGRFERFVHMPDGTVA